MQSYEARIEALDRRLQEAEARNAKAPVPAASPAAATVAAAPAATPAAVSASNSAFNPAIYAVLQGAYINQSKDPDKYAIAGFVPSGDIGPGKRGFSIAESELGFSANVDHKFFGNLILALTPDNNVEVEEAYGVFTALPGGVTPKFGRFLSSVGYLNDQHQHAWDFYDAPLVYQAFFGGQFRNVGSRSEKSVERALAVAAGRCRCVASSRARNPARANCVSTVAGRLIQHALLQLLPPRIVPALPWCSPAFARNVVRTMRCSIWILGDVSAGAVSTS